MSFFILLLLTSFISYYHVNASTPFNFPPSSNNPIDWINAGSSTVTYSRFGAYPTVKIVSPSGYERIVGLGTDKNNIGRPVSYEIEPLPRKTLTPLLYRDYYNVVIRFSDTGELARNLGDVHWKGMDWPTLVPYYVFNPHPSYDTYSRLSNWTRIFNFFDHHSSKNLYTYALILDEDEIIMYTSNSKIDFTSTSTGKVTLSTKNNSPYIELYRDNIRGLTTSKTLTFSRTFRVINGSSAVKNHYDTIQSKISGFGGIEQLSKIDPRSRDAESFVSDPIDVATGAQVFDKQLLSVQGAISIPFRISYNSLLTNKGSMGKGWEHNFETRLKVVDDKNIIIRWSANRKNHFVKDGDGDWISLDQATMHDRLIFHTDGTYQLKRKDKAEYIFNTNGLLIEQHNGRGQLVKLHYDASGRLAEIVEPISGKNLLFQYTQSGLVESVQDPLQRTVNFSYDDNSHLISITDANNQKTTYTYNQLGQVLTGINNEGVRFFQNTYDQEGRIINQDDAIDGNKITTFEYIESLKEPGKITTIVTNRNGFTRKYIHDKNLHLLSIVDELGHTEVANSFDMNGNLISTKDANGNVSTFTYDTFGNMLTSTDPAGNTTTFVYDTKGNVSSITDAKQGTSLFYYNQFNNFTRQIDPLGRETRFSYNEYNLLSAKTDPGSITTTYHYEKGLLHKTIDSEGLTYTNEYDEAGRLIKQIDPMGNETITVFDNLDNKLEVIDKKGNSVRFTYNSYNQPLTETDEYGNVTSFEYNANGKLIKKIDPLQNEFIYEYDGEDRVIKEILPNKEVITYHYDAKGQLLTKISPLGNSQSFEYDKVGNVITKIDGFGRVFERIIYDSRNNPIQIIDGEGNSISSFYNELNNVIKEEDQVGNTKYFKYDAIGKLLEITDRNSNKTIYNYNDMDQLISVTNALGNTTQYTYDYRGNLLTVANAEGNITEYQYNMSDKLILERDPLGNETHYKYDPNGNLIERIDSKGQVTVYEYTKKNQLQQTIFQGEVTTRYEYDAFGNPVKMVDETGTTNYTYNQFHQLTTVVYPNGKEVNYTYDANGNKATMVYPDGTSVLYQYDANDKLIKSVDWEGHETVYTYNQNGQLVNKTLPNQVDIFYNYNPKGHVMDITSKDRQGTILTQRIYTYDAAGNRLSMTDETGMVTNYEYDAIDQLVSVNKANSITSYHYDKVGNRIQLAQQDKTIQYQYDNSDRLLNTTTLISDNREEIVTYDNDPNGNRVKEGDTELIYNERNQLVQITKGTDIVRYFYNGDGLRVRKDFNGEIIDYIYDITEKFPSLIVEMDENGIIKKKYIDGSVYDVENSSFQYFLQDALGSTIAITNTDGEIIATFDYDAFGQVEKSGDVEQTVLFAGEQQDIESNYIYLRSRYYDPVTGRFLTKDSYKGHTTDPRSLHRYVYVYNNPINLTDPSGFSPLDKFLDGVQIGLDVVGLIPGAELADLLNAGIYYLRGDKTNASLSASSAIPFLGNIATVAKYGSKITDGIKGAGNTTPNINTGTGYNAGDVPVRIQGPWSINDMKQGLLGHSPRGINKPDLHHGGQMPGSAKHEIIPSQHRNNQALHQNKYNQGVTPDMRQSDRQLHWWYRAREQGADQLLPDWIYDKK